MVDMTMNDEQRTALVQKMRDKGDVDRMMLTAYKGMQGGDSEYCQTTLLLHISRSLELNTDALNRIASALENVAGVKNKSLSYNDKLNAIYDAKLNKTLKNKDVYLPLENKGLVIYVDDAHEYFFLLKCKKGQWYIEEQTYDSLVRPIDDDKSTKLLNKIDNVYSEVQ